MRYTKDKDFLRGELTQKNRTIAILAALLGLSVALIVAALIIDFMNDNVGFIWLRGLLYPAGSDAESIKETAMHIMHILRG